MAKKEDNPLYKVFDRFKKKNEKLFNNLYNSVKAALAGASIQNLNKIIIKTINKKFKKKIEKIVMDQIVISFNKTATKKQSYDWIKKWYLSKRWINNSTFSSRVWKVTNDIRKTIAKDIRQQLVANANIGKLASSIFKKKLSIEGLPIYINDLVKEGRKVIKGKGLTKEYLSTLKKAERNIKRLHNLGSSNSRLKKAYNAIINSIDKLSDKSLDIAIKRSIKAKGKYYAERLARTEMAKAYGDTAKENYKNDTEVIGIRSVLSTRHKYGICGCDAHANQNRYDLGPGGFPIGQLPAYPYHPNCMCILKPIYKKDE